VEEDLKASTQLSAVPEQWSAESSSQASPCEAPVQAIVSALKASAGQLPEEPVQSSATSHCPVELLQVTDEALKASTQELALPEQ
jgi:hypothetical protein